jgi:fermentation-respiration switch protein FrsA (DUF1100 family)
VLKVPWYVGWLLFALFAAVALQWVANRALYHPFRYPQGFWDAQSRIGARDVWLQSAGGARIHGWFVQQPGSPLVTLFFHGNAGNLTHRFQHFREIAAAGSSVLIIDYRGFGRSTGKPVEDGLYSDADAAYRYAVESGYGPGQIVIHGESLGAAVAVDIAARERCRALILEAPFPSAGAVAATVLPLVGPLLVRSFDSRRKIARVRAPILFIQGREDEVVPIRLGRELYAAAPEPKAFWTIPRAGHNDIIEAAGVEYRQRLRSFYDNPETR